MSDKNSDLAFIHFAVAHSDKCIVPCQNVLGVKGHQILMCILSINSIK